MRMRWFGESWLAPICDPRYKIDAPSVCCLGCSKPILPNERGIAMAFGGPRQGDVGKYAFSVTERGVPALACASHIDCHLLAVVPGMSIEIERVGSKTVELGRLPDSDPPWPYAEETECPHLQI